LKPGASEQPSAETLRKRSPAISKPLWLYLTLNTPIINAPTTATLAERVRICPAAPTESPKVTPMSTRSRLVNICPDCAEKLDMTSEGRTSLLGEP